MSFDHCFMLFRRFMESNLTELKLLESSYTDKELEGLVAAAKHVNLLVLLKKEFLT